MATVFEKPTGRRFKTSITAGPMERGLTFGIKDATDGDDAEAAFLLAVGGVVPAVLGGLPLSGYDFEEDEGEGIFNGRAVYSIEQGGGGAIGETRISFNTSGGSQHISESISLVSVHGATAAEAGVTIGARHPIGATLDSVEGADVPVAIFEWEITKTFDDADVDDAYVAIIEELTGKTNNATFKGRAEGEVLFLGAAGQQVNESPWEITFRFATSKNKTGMTIGSITGVAKKGWELLDVRYKPGFVGTGAFFVTRMIPVYVLIHKVFDAGDLSTLDV